MAKKIQGSMIWLLMVSLFFSCSSFSDRDSGAPTWYHLSDSIGRVDGGIRPFGFSFVLLSSPQDIWLFNRAAQQGEHYSFDLGTKKAELMEQITLPSHKQLFPSTVCYSQGKLWFSMLAMGNQYEIYSYDIAAIDVKKKIFYSGEPVARCLV